MTRAAERRVRDERADALDLVEIPAAVVCATCGSATCPGCAELDEPTNASGVVTVVPWERPGGTSWERLWTTSRLATVNARGFFGALPDGGLAEPARFAAAAETLALGSFLAVIGPVAYAVAPRFVEAVLSDPAALLVVAACVVVGLPFAVAGMVGLHVVWGLALELGARRAGARARWRRGLRFALYSCGWDAVTSPAGFFALTLTEGAPQAVEAIQSAIGVPRTATSAYLRGVHALGASEARRASRIAVVITGAVVAVMAAFVLLLAVVAALLA